MAKFRSPITEEELTSARSILKKTGLAMGDNTICNRIYTIHKMVMKMMGDEEMKNKINLECETALIYAKRMDAKLKEYHGKGEYEL